MEEYFEEAENKKNKKKIILIVIFALLFIAAFSILGIKLAEDYNKKIIEAKNGKNNIQTKNTISKEENIINENVTINENVEKSNNKLPVYSEEAKNKLKNLYTTNEKIAYLTFDDGPSKTVTPQILDLLKKENIKATFFVLGLRVKANPELVKREYEEGHYIANHGYSHEYSQIYKSVDDVINEYRKTEKAIQNALGNSEYNSHLFRFPGGSNGGKYAKLKEKAKERLHEENISYIDWNALTSDAAGANTKEKLLQNLKDTVEEKNNVVILMHDAANKILTYETLPDVIQYLREQGYTFDNFYSIMK